MGPRRTDRLSTVALSVVDRRWQDHLYELEALRMPFSGAHQPDETHWWSSPPGQPTASSYVEGHRGRSDRNRADPGPASGRHRKAVTMGRSGTKVRRHQMERIPVRYVRQRVRNQAQKSLCIH